MHEVQRLTEVVGTNPEFTIRARPDWPAIGLLTAAQASPSIELGATHLAARFSIPRNTILSDLVRFDTQFPGTLDIILSSTWSISEYHAAVDRIGRSWQDRIPDWVGTEDTNLPNQATINKTGVHDLDGVTYIGGGEAHFNDPNAYGFIGVIALRRLFDFGISEDNAAEAIRRVAALSYNPNGTIGTTPGIVSLNDWFIHLGLPILGPGTDVTVDNLVVARYIIGRHHPHEYFDYFHENVLADMLRIFGQGFWSWHYLVNISDQELSDWRTTHQAWDIGWRSLLNRTQGLTEDNAKDIAAVLIRRGILWPAQIPFTPLDDISLLLINAGVWGPLFPNPAHGDWNEPVESPVVAWRMVVDRTGNPITLGQVESLYELFKIPSVPAYWLTTIDYDAAEYYRLLSMAYISMRDIIIGRGVLFGPDAAALVREFFEKQGDLNQQRGIVDETLIAHLVTALTAVSINADDVNTVESTYGWEDQINFEGIVSISAEKVLEILNTVVRHFLQYTHLRDMGFTDAEAIHIIKSLLAIGAPLGNLEHYPNKTAVLDYLESFGIFIT